MFLLAIKKMLKNKWITLCLFFGCFLIIAIASCIPTYINGMLGKMLIKDFQNVEQAKGIYPGLAMTKVLYPVGAGLDTEYKKYTEIKAQFNDFKENDVVQKMNPIYDFEQLQIGPFIPFNEGADHLIRVKSAGKQPKIYLNSNNNISDKITMVKGKMYRNDINDGCYEAIVSRQAMSHTGLNLDQIYEFYYSGTAYEKSKPYKIKITGVFEMTDPEDLFWAEGFKDYEETLLMDFDTVANELIQKDKNLLSQSKFSLVYDYNSISPFMVPDVLDTMTEYASKKIIGKSVTIPGFNILQQYSERKGEMQILIIMLEIPLLLILMFYTYMVAKLIVGHDENEISVFKSRGASKTQIIKLYLIECMVISALSIVVAVPTGMSFASIVGFSNGFLEFVNRKPIEIGITFDVVIYALLSILLFLAATLIPVVFACRKNILTHKQDKANQNKTPLWQKVFLDVILIALSLYGLYTYNEAQAAFEASSGAYDASSNPLIFAMSSIFIVGVSLFALRIYPLVVKLIHLVGRKFWSPSLHVSMINLSRNKSMGKLIILFLMVTISVGVFDASMARTVNNNAEDRIYYKNGADLVVDEEWQSTGVANSEAASGGMGVASILIYGKPPAFLPYTQLKGIDSATKVLKTSTTTFSFKNTLIESGVFMAVEPDTFSKTAWFKDGLLDYHLNEYLSLLSEYPYSCLLSKSTAEENNVKIGDDITIEYDNTAGNNRITLKVFGLIDYFPTYDNHVMLSEFGTNQKQPLVVANIDYVLKMTTGTRYSVWLKRTEGATTKEIYDSIADKQIKVIGIKNSQEEIIQDVKNNPTIQGINGTLSLAFIISMVATAVGFLIYWIVDIKSRMLQFSILRSMGISKLSLYIMIGFEQLFTSCFAIVIGIMIGGCCSSLFTHSIGLYLDAANQIIPFKTIIEAVDYQRILTFAIILILVCYFAVAAILKRINIAATLKLGED